MTREEIIRMAREAGWPGMYAKPLFSITMQEDDFLRFAAFVAAAEREACAKVCDFEVARLTAIDEPRPALAAGICAAAVRARGEK